MNTGRAPERIRVTKQFHFEMAHALHGHDGKCAQIHGHSYVLFVTVIGTPLNDNAHPKNGMVVDFGDLKRLVNTRVVERFDHALVLNEIDRGLLPREQGIFGRTIFTSYQPTCENLLTEIVALIRPELPKGVSLRALRLVETPTSYAEWYEEDQARM